MDEVVPIAALSSAQSPAQSADEMQLAIGFAIREELAKSGDLDGAVAKARGPPLYLRAPPLAPPSSCDLPHFINPAPASPNPNPDPNQGARPRARCRGKRYLHLRGGAAAAATSAPAMARAGGL